MQNEFTTKQIREALRAKYGARNYKILVNGDVIVHGVMPNSNTDGWWYLGRVDDSITHCMIGLVEA